MGVWIKQHASAASHSFPLYSVSFVDDLYGWACGGGDTIIHTTDGGAHWTRQTVPTSGHAFWNIHFIDRFRGWASDALTEQGYVETSDGGATWTRHFSVPVCPSCTPSFPYLDYIFFVDANHGWAVDIGGGTSGHVWRTTNGGTTWTDAGSPTGDPDLQTVFFVDSLHGWAADSEGRIAHSSDGGVTWTLQPNPGVLTWSYYAQRSILFKDASHGWACGVSFSAPSIIHTSDGGATWAVQGGDLSFYVNLDFGDLNRGIAVSLNDPVLSRTYDGGATWIDESPSGGAEFIDLRDVSFPDPFHAWVTTNAGDVYVWIDAPDPGPPLASLPSGVARPGPLKAYVAERGGDVILEELHYESMRVTRPLNQTGTATIVVPAASSGVLGFIRSYEHEVVVVDDDQVVWAGPVVKPQWKSDGVMIPAQDLGLGWLAVRHVVRDQVFFQHDVAQIAWDTVSATLAIENSMRLELVLHPQGTAASEEYRRSQHQPIADALRSLVTKGLQFTVVERTLLIGPPLLPTLNVTDEVLKEQTIGEDDTATSVSLVGAQTPGVNQPVEWTSGALTRLTAEAGMVERTINDARVLDLATAITAADHRLAGSFPPPVIVSGVLAPGALAFRDLVPGRSFALALSKTDRTVNEISTLLLVEISASPGQQSVTLGFGPLST